MSCCERTCTFSDVRDFAGVGISTMSLSIKFTRMLPLQHGIVTNWDDMEPDIDFHEKIDVLHGRTLMVGGNQKDSCVSDEA